MPGSLSGTQKRWRLLLPRAREEERETPPRWVLIRVRITLAHHHDSHINHDSGAERDRVAVVCIAYQNKHYVPTRLRRRAASTVTVASSPNTSLGRRPSRISHNGKTSAQAARGRLAQAAPARRGARGMVAGREVRHRVLGRLRRGRRLQRRQPSRRAKAPAEAALSRAPPPRAALGAAGYPRAAQPP